MFLWSQSSLSLLNSQGVFCHLFLQPDLADKVQPASRRHLGQLPEGLEPCGSCCWHSPVIAEPKPRQVLDILYGDGPGETSPVQSWFYPVAEFLVDNGRKALVWALIRDWAWILMHPRAKRKHKRRESWHLLLKVSFPHGQVAYRSWVLKPGNQMQSR